MIRLAKEADIDSIMIIVKQTIEDMQIYGNEQWDYQYPTTVNFAKDIANGTLYVVEEEKQVVGFMCIDDYEPEEYDNLNWHRNDNCMVIHRMAIHMEVRKKGIATQLVNHGMAVAKEKGARLIKTDTNSRNPKMKAFFEKYGFNFVGEIAFMGKESLFHCYELQL